MEYEAVIGLETHVQLKTKSKMWCGCAKICLLHLFLMPLAWPAFSQTNLSAQYSAVLERWHTAIRSMGGLSFTPYFGGIPGGSASARELDDSVKTLASYGANMIPWLVEQIKNNLATTNRNGNAGTHVEDDANLLFMLGGIQIGIGTTNYYGDKRLEDINRFVREWDAGVFTNLDKTLARIRDESKEDVRAEKVDFKKTFPYRQYGVFAIPFLINEIRSRNSGECFNAFLIITFERDLYVSHYENPRHLYATQNEKMDFIRNWWKNNRDKFSQLGELPNKIEGQINQK
jgi:hypothetical protein